MELHLAKHELDIMEILWDAGGKISPSEIRDGLNGIGRVWKAQTLNTTLVRLELKGLVHRERGSVEAICTKQDYLQYHSSNVINSVYDGKLGCFVDALTGGNRITPEDKEELDRLIEKYTSDMEENEK